MATRLLYLVCRLTWWPFPELQFYKVDIRWFSSNLHAAKNAAEIEIKNWTSLIIRTLQVPQDYHFILRSHGTINLNAVTVIQLQLSQVDMQVIPSMVKKNSPYCMTLQVHGNYHFISQSHVTININIILTFTITLIQAQLLQIGLYIIHAMVQRKLTILWDPEGPQGLSLQSRSHGTINVNINLPFTVTIINLNCHKWIYMSSLQHTK